MLSTRDAPPVSADLIPFLDQTNAQAYSQLAASLLIIYEHLALLESEIHYMWKWEFTNVTILFLVNRYILLVSAALGVLSVFDWTNAMR
ncbi:hypothetical protein EVJ58_g38 [Rhodofomes roseus]|uniref:DUF6533 domain-containing protein n=1 Tax=Rhodofomes roseus TaxID=34475 RepID=A0A4Y9Z7J7_9APHY|nr:hypothetical protein EVJ58_g38 [Rhodofomes roseus]